MKIVLFEGAGFKNLLPLVYFRPVWELRCGPLTLNEKIRFQLKDTSFFYLSRDHLQKYYLDESVIFDLTSSRDPQYNPLELGFAVLSSGNASGRPSKES